MLIISDDAAFDRTFELPIDPQLKQLLIERRDQLGGDITGRIRFIIAQSDDTIKAVEQKLGFEGLSDPENSFGCEWVADHGAFYEAVWILTDDGYAHVILASKQDGNRELLTLCELYVTEQV